MLNGEKLEGLLTVIDSVTEPPIRLTGGGRVVRRGRQ